jgi:hypothetical protein
MAALSSANRAESEPLRTGVVAGVLGDPAPVRLLGWVALVLERGQMLTKGQVGPGHQSRGGIAIWAAPRFSDSYYSCCQAACR